MNIDYDLFVIDPNNKRTTEWQLRDCLRDALDCQQKQIDSLSRSIMATNSAVVELMTMIGELMDDEEYEEEVR